MICMDMAISYIKMGQLTKANSMMIRRQGLAYISGLIIESMKDGGMKINSMG